MIFLEMWSFKEEYSDRDCTWRIKIKIPKTMKAFEQLLISDDEKR